jgi:hypothetical protein
VRALGLGLLLAVCAGCVGQYGPDVPPPPAPVVIVPAPVYVVPAPVYYYPYPYYRPYWYRR